MSQHVAHSKMAYTVREAAKLISLSRSLLYRLIDLGEIQTIKIGRARRITSHQLEAFLKAREDEGVA